MTGATPAIAQLRERARPRVPERACITPDAPPLTPAPQRGAPKRLLPNDSAGRKLYPICAGVVDYFPDALAEVAKISFRGNEKHNPGEPMHHARGKSMGHADCIVRHLVERGSLDAEGNRHSAQLAWRALALLQEELEIEKGLSCPRGATPLPSR